MFCPMTKEECTDDCAWFIEGGCAVLGVCGVSEHLESLEECIQDLEDIIRKKDFTVWWEGMNMDYKKLIIEMLNELDTPFLKNVYFFIRGILGVGK